MPDRIIRDELLESERWLTLKDNADRLAYITLLLRCDDYGNYSAEPFRLMRMWRDFGIATVELVAKTLTELMDHDLIRVYTVESKHYLHLPRFKNARRYWSRKFPKSPFIEQDTIESNQQVTENPAAELPQTCANPSGGVGVGVGEESLYKDTLLEQSANALNSGDAVKTIEVEIVQHIPLVDGTEWPVTRMMFDELEKLYPAVETAQTLREIRAWNLTHPKNRKTKRGVMAHINTWFNKEQNRG